MKREEAEKAVGIRFIFRSVYCAGMAQRIVNVNGHQNQRKPRIVMSTITLRVVTTFFERSLKTFDYSAVRRQSNY